MNQKKKTTVKRIVALVCVTALVLTLSLLPILAKEAPKQDGPTASILSATAELGSIERKIIGGGTLAEAKPISLSVPVSVKLTGFAVSNGQTVKKGDKIADVDRVTVMTSIARVQESLDLLAKEIEAERKKETLSEVTASVGGTVKAVYATEGESVQSVMLRHGALVVLSPDGLMAVEFETDSTLTAGSGVTLSLPDGTKVGGKVATNLSGTMTVTVEDDAYTAGDTALVTDENGATLGSGPLFVYSPWNASAYTGTVNRIKVSVGDTVKAGKTLLTLSDTGYTARFQKLISQRQSYEEMLCRLFEMYQTEELRATEDGTVSGIDQNSTQLLSGNTTLSPTLLANAPSGDDETLYSNYLASVTGIGENGWTLLISSNSIPVADYKNLPGELLENAPLNRVTVFDPSPEEGSPLPVYEQNGDTWVSLELTEICEGDILLLAENETAQRVWAVRLQKASTPDTPTLPDENTPSENSPSQPDGSNETGKTPEGNGQGTTRPDGIVPDGGNAVNRVPQSQQEPEEELFDLTVTEVATITSRENMSMEISVDELDVHSVQIGMEAVVKINALGGEKITAKVIDVGNVGSGNGGNSKFTVTLSFPRGENMLAGMKGTAALVPATVEHAVTVSAKALVEQENQTVIYTAYDEKEGRLTCPVTVKIGVSDGETVQILDGLSEGEAYYYAYYDTPEISDTPDFGKASFRFGR